MPRGRIHSSRRAGEKIKITIEIVVIIFHCHMHSPWHAENTTTSM
jgi:hypothetical protein